MKLLLLHCITFHSPPHVLIQLLSVGGHTLHIMTILLTLEIGILKSRPKERMVRVKITTNTTKAAFSKSVNWSYKTLNSTSKVVVEGNGRTKNHTKKSHCSIQFLTSRGLNSTRHPIGESGGGGLNLIVCQLVD